MPRPAVSLWRAVVQGDPAADVTSPCSWKPVYLDRDELLRAPASRSMRRSSAHRAPRSHPYADADRCASLPEVGEKHFGAFWEFTEDVPVMSARQPRGSRDRGGYGLTNASSEGDGATFNGKSSKRTSTAAPTGREAASLSQVPVDSLPTPMFHGRCDAATANLPTVEEWERGVSGRSFFPPPFEGGRGYCCVFCCVYFNLTPESD